MLTYGKDFGLHHIDATADHENYYLNVNGLSASRAGLAFPGNTNLAGAATPLGSSSQEDNHRIESYLLLANYNYNSKYLLSASIRYDGSSRFSPETRWGTPFWAVGGAWMLNKENFLNDVSWLDMLKVKASYGTNGNEALGGYYTWQSLYDLNYANGGDAGAIIANLGSNTLSWEHVKQLNAGFEAGLFKNRVNVEFNYFVKTNTDMLYYLPMPLSTGITSRPANIMDMENKGIELAINADVVRSDDFTWNTKLNLTHFKNEITKMPESEGQDSVITGNYMYTKGHSIYEYYLVESAGINHENGDELYYYYDANGNKLDTNNYAFAVANGKSYQGSSLPDLIGSFRNTFTYKGFGLDFMFTFGLGGKYYDGIYQGLMGPGAIGQNWHEDILNSWTPENTDADLPRLEMDNQDIGQNSTRWLVDASYLSLRNVSLSYTFNSKWIKSAGLQSLMIYVNADNLMLLSKRKGMDPQATFAGNPDYIYSPARTVMFGVKVGL
jgi:TonB-linked SusC/RagA family outer membrane protein